MSEPLATPKLSRVAAHDPCAAANARFASRLVEALPRGGTREAVISPGSRNTPLALALLAAPGLRAHVVLDERGHLFRLFWRHFHRDGRATLQRRDGRNPVCARMRREARDARVQSIE